jgi:bacterioferritin
MPKGSKALIQALNNDLADELAAVIQYMYHHVMGRGPASPAILDLFKSTSIAEMKHAEALAERIDLLGGVPTIEISPIKVGGGLTKMIRDDLAAENSAIKMYKSHIKLAAKEDDPVTRHLLEEILEDEEGHANTWETVLEK